MMHAFISIADKEHESEFNSIVKKLKKLGCTIKGKLPSIRVITGVS